MLKGATLLLCYLFSSDLYISYSFESPQNWALTEDGGKGAHRGPQV